jgi:segregation and condensation protein B
MNEFYIRNIAEAALLAAGKPLTLAELGQLFDEGNRPKVDDIRAALDGLAAEYSNRGLEVKETAAGFRIQVRREFAGEISRLWPERPPKYSRALLETLALIAYRQPITRAEIEAVRGVAVNPNIVKTVIERNWVRVVGHRDVPGRPELLGTTREFLDYFGLRSLDELPPLAELKAMSDYNLQLDLPNAGTLEGPKGEGEVEGVAGLLGNDAAASGESDQPEAVAGDAPDEVAASADTTAAEHGDVAAGPHDAISPGVPDAVPASADEPVTPGTHDEVVAETHDPVTSIAHDAVAAASHDPIAKADTDDDSEADRTLSSSVDGDSSDLHDALDDTSEDDSDDDELSADGHGSRELVAAPRDSDT